uniref:Uncharacterized protein n=1 Tax=Anguilla anguilla TaxID=7936 RepID=A0A0E9P600_ANGAN
MDEVARFYRPFFNWACHVHTLMSAMDNFLST